MAGQSANEGRKEVAKRLNDLECTKQKTTGSSKPHGEDHYNKKSTKDKGIK